MLWIRLLTSIFFFLWGWWRCSKIGLGKACSLVSGLIFDGSVIPTLASVGYFDEILVTLTGKWGWERNRESLWGWNSFRWSISYHVYCCWCLAAWKWMLGLFTILMNRAGFLSVSVEPNAVCSGPISAAANHQERQFSFFQRFDARNLR